MKIKISGISPLLALLLVLALAIPVGITMLPVIPVIATVDNVTITSPSSGSPALSHVGGTVPITFTLGIIGPTDSVDVSLFLMKSGVAQGAPTNYTIISSDNSTLHAYTYNLTIPAGTANNTYDAQVQARHPSGTGGYTSSVIVASCIQINTASPALSAPTSPLPVTGTCTVSTGPSFSWTPPAARTGYTYYYNFQYAQDSAFSTGVVNTTGLATAAYTASALSHRTYYWHVQTQDQYGNQSVWTTTQNICIDPDSPGAITIDGPIDGYLSPGKYNPTFTWHGGTDASTCANVQYVVQTSTDTGFTNIVDTGQVYTTSYTIAAQLAPTSTTGNSVYYWRVKAVDCAGNASSFATYRSFQIPLTVSTYSIPLSAGWNLISLPLVPTNSSFVVDNLLTNKIAGISSYVVAVYYYSYGTNCSASSTSWKYWTPTGTKTLTTMEDGKAYWINVSQACTLTGYGLPVPPAPAGPPQYSLCYFAGDSANAAQGWNMMGFKSNQASLAISDYLGSTNSSKYSLIYRYAGGWVPTDPSEFGVPGVGYFINVNSSFSYPGQTN